MVPLGSWDERGVHCEVAKSPIIYALKTGRLFVPEIRPAVEVTRPNHSPKKPKSPVWTIATAFTSLAKSFKAESLPRISAIHRSLPCAESRTFVWVLTWYGGRGLGDTGGLVDVDCGLDTPCISTFLGLVRKIRSSREPAKSDNRAHCRARS